MTDVPRLELAAPERTRRSQAERTAETRARIMAAVVESIAEVGFQKTTASEISRRAGVTWGAVQHHFGGKDGILAAVLEDSFNRFAERLASLPLADEPLERRVAGFVEGAWQHFGSPHYRSTFEILLHYSGVRSGGEPTWQQEMLRAWTQIWDGIFHDSPLDPERSLTLQMFTISSLSGMASMQMLAGATMRVQDGELALLGETLQRALTPSS